jgi:hypothetical protein
MRALICGTSRPARYQVRDDPKTSKYKLQLSLEIVEDKHVHWYVFGRNKCTALDCFLSVMTVEGLPSGRLTVLQVTVLS